MTLPHQFPVVSYSGQMGPSYAEQGESHTTQEDNILNVDELQDVIKDDLKYRGKQLLRLKNEILDLEDL